MERVPFKSTPNGTHHYCLSCDTVDKIGVRVVSLGVSLRIPGFKAPTDDPCILQLLLPLVSVTRDWLLPQIPPAERMCFRPDLLLIHVVSNEHLYLLHSATTLPQLVRALLEASLKAVRL